MPTIRCFGAFIAGLALALVVSAADAQNGPAGNNQGTSTTNQSANQNPAVAAFLANPSALLTRYPLGGGAMVGDVRDLVVADLQTVDTLLSLIPTSNQDQKNAIGTGLGLAAMSLVRTDPQAGTTIQQALARLNDQIVIAAYVAVTGDQRLAAAGPGAGGSPGGGESATAPSAPNGGISGASTLFPSFSTKNTGDTFTFPTLTNGTPPPPGGGGGSVSPSTP